MEVQFDGQELENELFFRWIIVRNEDGSKNKPLFQYKFGTGIHCDWNVIETIEVEFNDDLRFDY